MATYKVTNFINHQSDDGRSYGWSESMYVTATNVDVALDKWQDVILARMNCCGSGSTSVARRATNIDAPSNSKLKDSTIKGDLRIDSDNPQQSVLVKVKTTDANKANLIFRGVWDRAVEGGEYLGTFMQHRKKLGDYLAALKVGGFMLRGRDFTVPLNVIREVTDAGVVRMIDGVNTLTLNDQVQLYRCYGPDGQRITGTFKLDTFTDTSNFKLLHYGSRPAIVRGKLRLVKYTTHGIDTADISHLCNRKVGRPFGLVRARS